jgi:hypothetical protein
MKSLKTFGYTNGVRFLFSLFPKDRIALTNASNQKDGYGAQIQRILSIKALADKSNISFHFAELKHAEKQITQTIHEFYGMQSQLTEFNTFLSSLLGGEDISVGKSKEISLKFGVFHDFSVIAKEVFNVWFRDKCVLISLEDAYVFLRKSHESYRSMKLNRDLVFNSTQNGVKRIEVHLRYVNFAQGSERYLDPNYYIENLNRIVDKLLSQQKDYMITIHSDFAERLPEFSTIGIQNETQEYLQEIGVLDSSGNPNSLVLEKAIAFKKFIKENFRNTVELEGEDALLALIRMANADFLICSKSSLSYVAGLLNITGEISSPRYWNEPLGTWKNSSTF